MTIDLTGKRFGRWIAIQRLPASKWLCCCECGTHKAVSGGDLRADKSKSCGCLRRDLTGDRLRADLKGKRFGRLTVTELVGSDKHQKALWLCRCDCGNTVKVGTGDLTSGKQRSCSCSKRGVGNTNKNETGKQHGKLTVLRWWGTTWRHRNKWLCQCSCGNQTVVTGDYLRNGDTKSCGCLGLAHAKRLGQTMGKYNRTQDNYIIFNTDKNYADRMCYLYFVEVEKVIDKIGIANDITARSNKAYTEVWYSRQMPRAFAWVVEQVALNITKHARPENPPPLARLNKGESELRFGLPIDETVELLDELSDEAERLGWKGFWRKHSSCR